MVVPATETNWMGNASTTSQAESQQSSYMLPFIEIPLLILLILIGTIGNLFIIGAALIEKRLRKMGVAFIINLAVADLVVTSWYLAQVLANVLSGYRNSMMNVMWLCRISGFLVSWCCQVSVMSLMFLALSRYMKLKKSSSYDKWFGQKPVTSMIIFIWLECFVVALPLVIGWNGSGTLLGFDAAVVSCMWKDNAAPDYKMFLVVVAVCIPLIATAFFYVEIYRHVRKTKTPRRKEVTPSRRKSASEMAKEQMSSNPTVASELSSYGEENSSVRRHHARHNSLTNHKLANSRRTEERERNLMLALFIVLVLFLVFWTPYVVVVFWPTEVSELAKRACAWLALSHSAINSMVYGALNIHFRKGYVTLCKRIGATICCCCWEPVYNWTSSWSTKSLNNSERKTSSQVGVQEYKPHSVKFG